ADKAEHVTKYTYSMSRGQFFAGNIIAKSGFFEFDLNGFDKVEHISLGVPGFLNLENALAASVAASLCGVKVKDIKHALETFAGGQRRLAFILNGTRVSFVGD